MSVLKNLRIIDLTRYVAGPHCTMILNELGAEVIKIEKCDGGDDLRNLGPKLYNTSLWSAVLNRGKKSLSLNIKTKEGKEVLLKLIEISDVLIENFRPGVMERLGFDWKKISKINKKIIMARISGYGNNKNNNRQAFDATVQAESGLMKISGRNEDEPIMIGTVLLDYTTGLNMAIGILSALYKRNITGKGTLVECSLVDAAMSLTLNAVPDYFLNKNNFKKAGNRDRFSVPSNSYKSKNGYIQIMAGSDDRFKKLTIVMKQDKLNENSKFNTIEKRLKNIEALDNIITTWTKKYNTNVIGSKLSKAGVPWGEVRTLTKFLKTEIGKTTVTKASVKNKIINVPKVPINFPFINNNIDRKVPLLGADNHYILKKRLRFNNNYIEHLEENKIINETF